MKFLKQEIYLPEVEKTYENLSKLLQTNLLNVDVEHIGSSAIKGAISKGDLDVLVRTSKENFDNTLDKIQTLNFFIKEGTLRTDSLCMLETRQYPIDVAIQLIEAGSEFEDFVKFRDLLNGNLKLVEEYNELKINSTGMQPDDYRAIKSKFIKSVLRSN